MENTQNKTSQNDKILQLTKKQITELESVVLYTYGKLIVYMEWDLQLVETLTNLGAQKQCRVREIKSLMLFLFQKTYALRLCQTGIRTPQNYFGRLRPHIKLLRHYVRSPPWLGR